MGELSFAQNLMIIHNALTRPGDTITLWVDITNADKFVSFQFDLQLPENVSYLDYSLQLSDRRANHVVSGNIIGSHKLRIFSYSPGNSAFSGNNGTVVSFSLLIGNIRGEFPLILENGIIGDSLSANILTSVENGTLSVFPLGQDDQGNKENDRDALIVFPNPVAGHTQILFTVAEFSEVTFILFDQDGKKRFATNVGNFAKGSHAVVIPNEMMKQLKPGKMYCLELSGKSKTGNLSNQIVKIIRIEN
ncbi:MAG: hypothetical protein M0P58_10425 [Bacteroidales bacterium]|jgi:hypothetical protein|nr:hypothetical protein [Bacteroidales bacterium]